MYKCPDPTPEQIELGKKLGFDPMDRCGNGGTDTAATDPLCAACLIHDEMFLRGGDKKQWFKINEDFERDVFILARAWDCDIERAGLILKAEEYVLVVWNFSWFFWEYHDRNTDITRAQGERFMREARAWINECARKLGEKEPYTI